jgi:signal transduction histidine kinase
MIGHDLRGPLQVIEHSVYLLRRSSCKKEEILEIIEDAVDRALKMLEDLRHRTRESPLQIDETNLPALIKSVAEEVSAPSSVELELSIGDGLETVELDPLKMRRVLDNLIRNAIEAMPNGGKLTVVALKRMDCIYLEVSDKGVGIPERFMPSLFKPFKTMKSGGLGLGLAYCKRVVEAHGGRITVKSKEGEGSIFTIELPLFE